MSCWKNQRASLSRSPPLRTTYSNLGGEREGQEGRGQGQKAGSRLAPEQRAECAAGPMPSLLATSRLTPALSHACAQAASAGTAAARRKLAPVPPRGAPPIAAAAAAAVHGTLHRAAPPAATHMSPPAAYSMAMPRCCCVRKTCSQGDQSRERGGHPSRARAGVPRIWEQSTPRATCDDHPCPASPPARTKWLRPGSDPLAASARQPASSQPAAPGPAAARPSPPPPGRHFYHWRTLD